MRAYRLHADVPLDIDEAARWYESRESGLGVDFVLAVEAAIALITDAPRAWPRWPNTPDDSTFAASRWIDFPS